MLSYCFYIIIPTNIFGSFFALYHQKQQILKEITMMYRIFLLLLIILIFLSPSNIFASQNDEYDPIQTVLALNYAKVSLVKVISYNDVIILEQEYDNIINNINLSKIQDYEIVSLFTGLMDILTQTKISAKQKEFVQRNFDKKVEKALYESFSSGLSSAMSNARDPYTACASALTSIGSSYFNYRQNLENYKDQRNEDEWKIDKQILLDLNLIRKEFFVKSWELQKKYEFPDHWRLSENQVEEYVEALKDNDPKRRYRKLKRMETSFKAYPPFWYYLGSTAQNNGDVDEALNCYQEFDKTRKGIFRKDQFIVSTNMKKIALIDTTYNNESVSPMLEEILDNSNNQDWNNYLFAALQYANINEYQKSEELLTRNIDNGYEVSLNKRVLGELILANKKDGNNNDLTDLINEMVTNDDVKNQDVLYLYGRTNNKNIIKGLEPQILSIEVSLNKNLIGKDDLIVVLPIKWFYDDLSASITIDGENFNNDKFSTVADERIAVCSFNGIIDSSTYIENNKDLTLELKLKHQSENICIVLKGVPGEVKKDKHDIAQWAQNKMDSSKSENNKTSKWSNLISSKIDDIYAEKSLIFSIDEVLIGNQKFHVKQSKIVFD